MNFSLLGLCSLLLLAALSHVQGGLIGTLPTEQHDVSGRFYIVNAKTLFFEDFNYDGGGPGAYLYFYRPGVAVDPRGGGVIIPLPPSVGQTSTDHYPGAFQRRRFTNEDFMVTLPDRVDACDIGTITVWCQPFTAIFTRLTIPRDVFTNDGNDPCTVLNPGGPPGSGPEFDNCKVLDDTLQLSWRVDNANSRVRFRLCGCASEDANTIQYLGFGLSRSNTATSMFQADATIAWIDRNGMAQAKDYYLSDYVQCRGGRGACPDTMDNTTGRTCTDDVSDVSGFFEEGQQCISFTRPFNPTDSGSCDRPIDPNNQNQYIVWGIGSLGETAFQHHTRARSGDPPIHLGRTPDNECDGQLLICTQCEPFRSVQMIARENTTFEAVIGPAANPRGYTGITGRPGWGIAWYVNGTIVPELVVVRNWTYTFLVRGGDNAGDSSNYHPFYITDSVNGGRLLNNQQQRMTETVYAGFSSSDDAIAVGPLCELSDSSRSEVIRQSCGSYEDYINSLERSCPAGDPGKLIWTPDDSTPDLVYYQCASHLNLGREIQVINEGDPDPDPITPPPPVTRPSLSPTSGSVTRPSLSPTSGSQRLLKASASTISPLLFVLLVYL